MQKSSTTEAWLLVLPMVLLVAFNALIPLMTVVNYSVQDVFDSTHRAFVGVDWYREMLHNTRLQDALGPATRLLGNGAADRECRSAWRSR